MEPEQSAFSIATTPPSLRQRRLALGVVAVLFGYFLAIAPFASTSLPRFDNFYPTVDAIIFVTDLTTAVLLFNQFATVRMPALAILANGYLFSGLIAIPHALTFPGAFTPTGLLGAGLQTTPWLFTFWHFGFASAVLAYACLNDRGHAESTTRHSATPVIYRNVLAVAGLVFALTLGVTAGEKFVPLLLLSEVRFSPLANQITVATFLVTLLALVLLWIRGRSLLDLLVTVVSVAMLIEQGLTAFLISSRFSVGFYFGAVFSVVVSTAVLMILLSEIFAIYAKLSRANEDLRREQENKQLLVDELNRRESHLQEALAAGGVYAFEWDVGTDSSHRSGNAAQILGIDPKLIPTAESFLARVHPNDRTRLGALRSNLHRDNATCALTFRFRRPDGQEIWLQELSKAEFDAAGRLVRIKGLARDITERKRAEEHDALLQFAQASTGVTVWGWNVRTKEMRASPEHAELFGLKPGSMTAYADFRECVHPDDIEYVEANRDAAIQNHRRFQHEFRIIRPNGETRWLASTGSAVYDEVTGEPIRVLGSNFDITERKRAEERQGLLIAELDHRVKNILAQVAMVANATRQGSRSIKEFLGSLDGRIQSMAAAHTLLSDSGWQKVGLGTLVRDQLTPYATGTNLTISGTDVVLNAAETQAVARVLHELATNAAKYGALSTPSGRISVNWDLKPNGAATHLTLVWRELGGPPVAPEHPSSYGTHLIRSLIPHELGGTVDLAFAKEGVNCRIEIPIRQA